MAAAAEDPQAQVPPPEAGGNSREPEPAPAQDVQEEKERADAARGKDVAYDSDGREDGAAEPSETVYRPAAGGAERFHEQAGAPATLDEKPATDDQKARMGEEQGQAYIATLLYVSLSIIYVIVRYVSTSSWICAIFEAVFSGYLAAVFVTACGRAKLWGSKDRAFSLATTWGGRLRSILSSIKFIYGATLLFPIVMIVDVLFSFADAADYTHSETARDSTVVLPLIMVVAVAFSFAKRPAPAELLEAWPTKLLASLTRTLCFILVLFVTAIATSVRLHDRDEFSHDSLVYIVSAHSACMAILACFLLVPPSLSTKEPCKCFFTALTPLVYTVLVGVDVIYMSDAVLGRRQWLTLVPPIVFFVLYIMITGLDVASEGLLFSKTIRDGFSKETERLDELRGEEAAEAAAAAAEAGQPGVRVETREPVMDA